MTDRELDQEIKRLLVERLDLRGKTPDDIPSAEPLFGSGLGLDSLDGLELAMALEERFGVEVPEGEAGRAALASVQAIVAFVSQHRS